MFWLILLSATYFIPGLYFFQLWLRLINQSIDDSPDKFSSLVALIGATILWPVVVPCAYVDLVKRFIKTKADVGKVKAC